MILSSKGFILVTTLLLMLILSCITIPMLVQTSLSQKLVGSATLSVQLKQQTQSKHAQQLQQLKQGDIESGVFVVAPCPALYAAWSEPLTPCEWHQLSTSGGSLHFQYSVTSFLVRQSLPEGGRDELF